MKPRYAIGTKFMPTYQTTNRRVPGAHPHTIVDIYTTTNARGDVVKIDYLCEHQFCGQKVQSCECETTIARGIEYMGDLGEKSKK